MKTLYIYHNLGLGDHIICNGLVRCYAKQYDKVFVFCKPHNVNSVEYMYRDNKSIEILPVGDVEAKYFVKRNPQYNYLVVKATFGNRKKISKDIIPVTQVFKMPFDIVLYNIAKIPIEDKWNKFYFERNIEREKEVYKQFGLIEGDRFAFVHEDRERGAGITKHLPDMKIVHPDIMLKEELNVFDYLYIIEKAEEVHCIDSAFLNLIDCMQLRDTGLFFHKYVRDGSRRKIPSLKMNWKILNLKI